MKQIDKHAYGPWALVTGASSGIGEEFARQVAASGINVVLVARREERLREVAAELTARYEVQARVVALDLGRDGILGPVRQATDDLDIGLVVSNAGTGNPGPFVSLPHERLREVVQLNVITHLDLAHHFGQRLAERGHGGIVLVSAVAAAGGLPYMANDSATKAMPPPSSHDKPGKENQVKFMLQIRFNGADKAIGELPAGDQEKVTAEFEEIRRSTGVLDGNQLQAASTAATVRVDGRQPRVSEGPAVAAGSELDGYYLYDAADRDAAIAFAQRIPATRFGATVEVRPVLER